MLCWLSKKAQKTLVFIVFRIVQLIYKPRRAVFTIVQTIFVTFCKKNLQICILRIHFVFKKYQRSLQSRLKKKHKRIRFQTSKRMRHHDVKYWENYLISDEKIWIVDGYFNPQNDRVRARCKEDVESVERDSA